MFWNDPVLYGATLPYKDVPMQPWMMYNYNIPKFIPPTYGFTPPLYYNYLHQFPQVPQFQQFQQFPLIPQIPQMGLNPFVKPFELNQPFYGWNRQLI